MRSRWLPTLALLLLAVVLHVAALDWDLRHGSILGFVSPRPGWPLVAAAGVGLLAPVVLVVAAIGAPPGRRSTWRRRLVVVLVLGVLPLIIAGTAAAGSGAAPRAVWPFGAVWMFVTLLVALFTATGQGEESGARS